MIDKYEEIIKNDDHEYNANFFFNNKILNKDLKIMNYGLMNNHKIIVYKKRINIIFKINKLEGSGCPINIDIDTNTSCSKLIEEYLEKLDFSYRNKISKFIFNSKELDKNLTIFKSGIKDNSIIYVELKEPQQKLSIIIKYKEKEKKIDCLKFYLLSTLINQFKHEAGLSIYFYHFMLEKSHGKYEKELNISLSVEELGLRNNDVIVISYN